MKIKNISSSTVKIEDLKINLRPGETVDLSKIDENILISHPKLNTYIEKDILLPLKGHRIPIVSNSLKDLEETKRELEVKTQIKGNVVIKNPEKSKPSYVVDKNSKPKITVSEDLKKQIQEIKEKIIKNQPKQEIEIESGNTFKEIKEEGSYFGKFGYFNSQFSPTKNMSDFQGNQPAEGVKIKCKDIRNTIKMTKVDFQKTFHPDNDKFLEQEKINEILDLDPILERIKKRCVMLKGKSPCPNYALSGYKVCFDHLPDSLKRDYREKMKEEKALRKQKKEEKEERNKDYILQKVEFIKKFPGIPFYYDEEEKLQAFKSLSGLLASLEEKSHLLNQFRKTRNKKQRGDMLFELFRYTKYAKRIAQKYFFNKTINYGEFTSSIPPKWTRRLGYLMVVKSKDASFYWVGTKDEFIKELIETILLHEKFFGITIEPSHDNIIHKSLKTKLEKYTLKERYLNGDKISDLDTLRDRLKKYRERQNSKRY